jgi:hypothetical protein
MSEQEKQLQQRDPDETWSVPADDLDATWPIGDRPDLDGTPPSTPAG